MCPFEIEMQWYGIDEMDEMDKMPDAECSRLEMPADGVDEIDKMRDPNEQMRWSPQVRLKYGVQDEVPKMERLCQPSSQVSLQLARKSHIQGW